VKLLLIIVVAAIASASSFIVHVATVEWLPAWVGSQMQGIVIQPSWNVRYIAGATSIEYGIAASTLYYFSRSKFVKIGVFRASLLFAVLLAAIHGAFIRQLLMDYVVGNPFHVVLVQNGFKWLVWLLMSFVVVYGVEFIVERASANKALNSQASPARTPKSGAH
jgi:hypothetical protein